MARAPTATPPLRYLSAGEVDRCLPPVIERLELAATALAALATGDAEMPPKLGVYPRDGALLHAMPAWLRSADLVGLKWVAAFPANKAHRLPAISGLIVLNDPETGLPTWILEGARITAVRTAAVSGVAIRLLADDVARRVAVLGAGVQARSHLEVVAALLPGADVALHDRHLQRAGDLAAELNQAAGREWVRAAGSAVEAVAGAEVVISVATLGAETQKLTPAQLAPGALVVAVDFATYVAPELARAARLFAVDDREQYMRYAEMGYFDGYPEPTTTLGELVGQAAPTGLPDAGRTDGRPALVTHLGVGLADIVFADAISRRALDAGIGTQLER